MQMVTYQIPADRPKDFIVELRTSHFGILQKLLGNIENLLFILTFPWDTSWQFLIILTFKNLFRNLKEILSNVVIIKMNLSSKIVMNNKSVKGK